MDKYLVEQTVNTPLIQLDPNGKMEMKGVSISENSSEFFGPIVKWVEDYCLEASSQTNIDLAIEYMDSGSFGFFNVVLEKFNELHNSGSSAVSVKWSYESDDLDMEEYGEDLKRLYNFNVELNPLETV